MKKELILHENDIGIIGLGETKLEEQTVDHVLLPIEGYKIFLNERDSSDGGVAINVKDTFSVP